MKLNSKNVPTLLRLFFIFVVILTLMWEIVERLIGMAGGSLDLSVGPIGFDIEVVAFWLQVNPGSLLGIIPAIMLFRRI